MTREEMDDAINLRGKYALDPEEMYEAISILALSYGEEATRKIAAAWSRKAQAKGYTAQNKQLRLF